MPVKESRQPDKLRQKLYRWIENNRSIIVIVIVLPLSFLFSILITLQNNFLKKVFFSFNTHEEKVRKVQQQLRNWNKLHISKRKMLCTSRPNWKSLSTTFFQKDKCHQIHIPLYDILELKTENLTVKVEPFVTVGEICKYLIPLGYTLAVCLEVEEATLGGLAMGVGMTTYSHKAGLYQETIESYEILLSDGSVINVTKENEHSDLYYTLPWSHGTLGFLLSLVIKVIPIKPYLKLEYIPVKGQTYYCNEIRKYAGVDGNSNTPDYVEAIIFSKEVAIIIIGNFSEVPIGESHKINCLTKWYKPWFYKYTETFLEKGYSYEYVPLRDYILRHNRSIFWVMDSMVPLGSKSIFRYFLGWLLPPKIAFLKLTTTPGIRALTFTKQVFQDIVLPMNQLEDQINKSEELFDIYPILIYPCRIYNHGKHKGQLRPPRDNQMVPGKNYGMFNDLGVYGIPKLVKDKKRYDSVAAMRDMERFTRDVGGYPFLYADTFMTRSEFEEMFDLTAYEKVRAKYKADGSFPHLYDKIKPEIDVFKIGKEYIDLL